MKYGLSTWINIWVIGAVAAGTGKFAYKTIYDAGFNNAKQQSMEILEEKVETITQKYKDLDNLIKDMKFHWDEGGYVQNQLTRYEAEEIGLHEAQLINIEQEMNRFKWLESYISTIKPR